MIKKPNWCNVLGISDEDDLYAFSPEILEDHLDSWFKENVEAYFKNRKGFQVYGFIDNGGDWCMFEKPGHSDFTDTHTAFLVDLQPIKHETEADLLEEIMQFLDAKGRHYYEWLDWRERLAKIKQRKSD